MKGAEEGEERGWRKKVEKWKGGELKGRTKARMNVSTIYLIDLLILALVGITLQGNFRLYSAESI